MYLEPIGPEIIANAQVELQKAFTALTTKRTELLTSVAMVSSSTDIASMIRPAPPDIASMGGTRWKWSTTGSEESVQARRRHLVQQEIDFLETLVEELGNDVKEMKYSKLTAEMARTKMGRIRSWLGAVFSIVLLVRLYTSFTSIWHVTTPMTRQRGDPITTALLWLTGHHLIVNQQDYNSISQCVSLGLTAFLSASQVRTFVRTMSALNMRLLFFYQKCYNCKTSRSRSQHHADDDDDDDDVRLVKGTQTYTDLLAAFMGCYFLSCVVLTKMNLPLEYRSNFTEAMGGINLVVQYNVANSCFCVSAAISATVLGLLFGIQRQNTKRHIADDDATLGNLDAC
jgi:hypothetical protein